MRGGQRKGAGRKVGSTTTTGHKSRCMRLTDTEYQSVKSYIKKLREDNTMTKITLINDFHGTQITLNIKDGKNISAGQVKKAWKTLCGVNGCTCGNELGMRGSDNPQIETRQDGSAYIN